MKPKNVLMILCDQMRKDCLGCYGNPYIRTPHLDALACESAAYERCYVANPICAPNRMSIFTGMYPRNHGVWTNGLSYAPPRHTLPEQLGALGYQTASIGKIHFSPTDCRSPEIASPEAGWVWDDQRADYAWHGPYGGFEYVELALGHQRQRGHYRRWFLENGGDDGMFALRHTTDDPASGTMDIPARLHSSAFVGERAREFLQTGRDRNRPFFLVASFPDPHHPFDPPAESEAALDGRDTRPPIGEASDLAGRPAHYRSHLDGAWDRSGPRAPTHPGGLNPAWRDDRIRKTYAMIELIDKNVGLILNALRDEGLAEDTLVIFTSDHGELLGDHGLWLKGPFFYEGLMNVPLLVKGAGIAPGFRRQLVSSVDIAPLICDYLGCAPLPFADGRSPLPPAAPRDDCLIEYRTGYLPNDKASFALVTERYKYVRHQSGEEELTDLAADPRETTNLTDAAHAVIRREMALRLLDAIIASGAKAPRQVCHA